MNQSIPYLCGSARPLDLIERFFCALNAIQRQNFIVHARLSSPVDEVEVRRAFAILVTTHEALRTAVVLGADGAPAFESVNSFDDSLCLVGPEWAYLRRHALQLDLCGSAGVRCLLVGSRGRIERVALVFDHALMDGRGALVLLGDLLRLTMQMKARHEGKPFAPAFKLQVEPENAEAAMKGLTSIATGIEQAFRVERRHSGPSIQVPFIHRMTVPPEALQAARQSAYALGVSSHAWLVSQTLASLREATGNEHATFAVSHAVDMRRFEQGAPSVACRAGLLLGSYRLSAGDSEEALAVRVQRNIQSGLACAFPVWLLNVLPWLHGPGDFHALTAAARAELASAPSYMVFSDLGSVDAEWAGVAEAVADVGLTVQPLPGQLAVITRIDLAGRSHLQLHTQQCSSTAGLLQQLVIGLTDRLGAYPIALQRQATESEVVS